MRKSVPNLKLQQQQDSPSSTLNGGRKSWADSPWSVWTHRRQQQQQSPSHSSSSQLLEPNSQRNKDLRSLFNFASHPEDGFEAVAEKAFINSQIESLRFNHATDSPKMMHQVKQQTSKAAVLAFSTQNFTHTPRSFTSNNTSRSRQVSSSGEPLLPQKMQLPLRLVINSKLPTQHTSAATTPSKRNTQSEQNEQQAGPASHHGQLSLHMEQFPMIGQTALTHINQPMHPSQFKQGAMIFPIASVNQSSKAQSTRTSVTLKTRMQSVPSVAQIDQINNNGKSIQSTACALQKRITRHFNSDSGVAKIVDIQRQDQSDKMQQVSASVQLFLKKKIAVNEKNWPRVQANLDTALRVKLMNANGFVSRECLTSRKQQDRDVSSLPGSARFLRTDDDTLSDHKRIKSEQSLLVNKKERMWEKKSVFFDGEQALKQMSSTTMSRLYFKGDSKLSMFTPQVLLKPIKSAFKLRSDEVLLKPFSSARKIEEADDERDSQSTKKTTTDNANSVTKRNATCSPERTRNPSIGCAAAAVTRKFMTYKESKQPVTVEEKAKFTTFMSEARNVKEYLQSSPAPLDKEVLPEMHLDTFKYIPQGGTQSSRTSNMYMKSMLEEAGPLELHRLLMETPTDSVLKTEREYQAHKKIFNVRNVAVKIPKEFDVDAENNDVLEFIEGNAYRRIV